MPQPIHLLEADTPKEVENYHRDLFERGLRVATGSLGNVLGDYRKEFSELERGTEHKAIYTADHELGRPVIRYNGDFDELTDYYNEVLKVRNL